MAAAGPVRYSLDAFARRYHRFPGFLPEPHVPSRVFTGNIADDAAVQAWVLSVMESKATP